MTCSYCGSRNGEGEHRCRRCGRRPSDVLNVGALATKLQPAVYEEPASRPQPVEVPGGPGRAAGPSRPVQRQLFQDQQPSKVIAFESYTTPAPRPKAQPRTAGTPAKRRGPRTHEDQTSLDFLPPAAAKPRTLGTTVEAVIYCEAPVATPLHRAVAAAIDWSIVLISYGLFLAAYFLCGGEFTLNKLNVIVFGASLILIAITYGLMWAIAGAETGGMHAAHLRLTTFDGFQPDRKQRLSRFFGSMLSMCTVLGMLWSLADEESLTWSDHISRTFPTPRELDALTFRRR
jgi:uncharacterized RDD family membrane protein YckC